MDPRCILLSIFSFIVVVQGVFGADLNCTTYRSCDECVKHDSKCYWCSDLETCFEYDPFHSSSYFKHCGWTQAKWKNCWLNVMALVIAGSVIGVILLIAMIVVCCWCNRRCRQRQSARMQREEAELERHEEERRERQDVKKAERTARANEVRQKYGLLKEDD